MTHSSRHHRQAQGIHQQDAIGIEPSKRHTASAASLHQLKAALGAALDAAAAKDSAGQSRPPSTTPDRHTPVVAAQPSTKTPSPDGHSSLLPEPRTPVTVGKASVTSTPSFPDFIFTPPRPANQNYCSPSSHSVMSPLGRRYNSEDAPKSNSPSIYQQSPPFQAQYIPTYQVSNPSYRQCLKSLPE